MYLNKTKRTDINNNLPQKYMQVRPKACENVPPCMELCYHSNTRGQCLSAGSEGTNNEYIILQNKNNLLLHMHSATVPGVHAQKCL